MSYSIGNQLTDAVYRKLINILPLNTIYLHSPVNFLQHILVCSPHLFLNWTVKFPPVYKVRTVITFKNSALDVLMHGIQADN